jgi:protein TonB
MPIRLELLLLAPAVVAMVTGCVPPPPKQVPLPPPPTQVPAPASVNTSSATTPLAYRKDAAAHVYSMNSPRIMKGKLPPNIYAVGVLQVEVGPHGEVTATNWMRAPKHAPEVVREIERIVRAADPFPAPIRMGKVTYTDTWLWDKSGNFQLDTLTEGQN